MNKKNVAFAILIGLSFAKGVFAASPETEKEEFDLNSITYVQEEDEIILGFDVADYLPEGFDPFKVYVDLNSFEFMEDAEPAQFDAKNYLPEDFNPYANPKGIEGINYIDENDSYQPAAQLIKQLPEGFNAYRK